MANTKSLLLTPKFKILLWSPSGTGKTKFAGTFREAGPMYFFDFDGRMQTLAGMDIDYDFYRDVDANRPKAYDEAKGMLGKLKLNNPYATVVLDSLTTFSEAAMNKAMPMVKQFMPNTKRINDGNYEIPVMQDYMSQMTFISGFIRELLTLDCNVIVIAHEGTDKDEVTNKIYKNIAVTGKLADKLPQLFNEIWRMQVQHTAVQGKPTTKYQLVTRPDNLYIARTTTLYAEALDMLEEPDYKHLVTKINAHLKKHPNYNGVYQDHLHAQALKS